MYEVIDGPEPERCRELLADDLRFAIVFSTGEVAQDFAGGREAFDAYLAQRDAPAGAPPVVGESSDGPVEPAPRGARPSGSPPSATHPRGPTTCWASPPTARSSSCSARPVLTDRRWRRSSPRRAWTAAG